MTAPETPTDPMLGEAPYPLQRHLGFRMLEWSQDFCRFELPLQPFLMNRYGIPHGGIHATLLDSAMGFCGCYTGDPDNPRMAMTLSLTINYLGQTSGRTLYSEARRTGGGARTFFAEGKVTDDKGTPLASASGVFRYRSSTRKA